MANTRTGQPHPTAPARSSRTTPRRDGTDNDNGRHSSSGSGSPHPSTSSPAGRQGDERPPAASSNPSGPAPISTNAKEVWAKIGADFVANRSHSRHHAFKQMQLDIMRNCATLSPDFFNPKDIVGMSMDIEGFLKDNPEVTGEDKSNLDLFAEFLRGSDEPQEALDMTDPSNRSVRII